MLPFAPSGTIEKELRPVHEYWRDLRRGENEMPFWDDVKLAALHEFKDRLMLIDAFERPERFRFGLVGSTITARHGKDVVGEFTNEIGRGAPFEYLTSQCSATTESSAPTYYERAAAADRKALPYARLLLPLWGEGSVRMLLGAVAWTGPDPRPR